MSCLFDSIARFVPQTSEEVRKLWRDEVLAKKSALYNGLPLEEWIRLETGQGVEDYVERVYARGWGGILDVAVLAGAYGCRILVACRVKGKSFSFNVGESTAGGKEGRKKIALRYTPGHWSPFFSD